MLRHQDHSEHLEEPEGSEALDFGEPRLSVPLRQRLQKSVRGDKELQGAEHRGWCKIGSHALSLLHLEWEVQGQSNVLWACPQLLGVRLVQAMPRGSVQVIERELSIEFAQCWFNDAVDGNDSKKLSILHVGNGKAADRRNKETKIMR